MAWIVSDIIHSKSNVQLDPKLQGLLEPLEPEFDQETLKKVDQNFSSLNTVPVFAPVSTPTPSPSNSLPSNEPESTDSADFDSLDNDISNL